MDKGSDSAVGIFNNGFNCSQAVLISHCEELGLDRETALKIACGFGGGMGHTGEICGAVTGAILLIGLKYGKYKFEDLESKAKTYNFVRKYTDLFKMKYGSINCMDLIKFDLRNEDEVIKARESGVFDSICLKIVQDSVELVEEIIGN